MCIESVVQKKKRGRKKKEAEQEKITDHMPTKKKKRDRFNGMSEDEVMKRELPDHVQENLDILIVSLAASSLLCHVNLLLLFIEKWIFSFIYTSRY